MRKIYILTITLAVVSVITIFGQYTYARLNNPHSLIQRWIAPYNGGWYVATASATITSGTVTLSEFENHTVSAVTGLCYQVGSAAAGSVRMAVYGPIVQEESALNSRLLVETASTTQVGTTGAPHCLNVATTTLPAGRFYVAFQGDNAVGTFMRHNAADHVTGFVGTFASAFGAFPSTVTAFTPTPVGIPAMKVRLTGY